MAKLEAPETEPQNPDGTSTPPAPNNEPKAPEATPKDGGGTATPDAKNKDGGDDELVTIRRGDLKNLQSQRDRNANASAYVESLAQKDYISGFLKENLDKYPDLTFEDLQHVWDMGDDDKVIHAEAARIQGRLKAHSQAKLLEIENPTPPKESEADRAAREEKLKKDRPRDGFQQMVLGRLGVKS